MNSPKEILLLYATNSGSTFVSGQIIKDVLSPDLAVNMQNTLEFNPVDIKNYDTIILGSPSWESRGEEGMPTETMLKLFDVWSKEDFSNKNFVIYGCGDDAYINFCGAVDQMEKFVNLVKGKLIFSSLRLNAFFFELDKNVELTKKWAIGLKEKLKTLV
ncbi:MAG TPA: flavodoxin domain-containing protein [Candidatus Udaeobacter sp.]|nr:flavodoxin domain-containing protein [Candidatus Udaeobacter sp.]